MRNKQTIKAAFLDTLPVMAGYLVLGMGFGLLLRARGFGVLWAGATSILVYAGSLQFVATDLIAGAIVVGLHIWRRNTLLSILAGTVTYILLVQLVF